MWKFKTRSEAILYVWDYFYVANVPAAGDEQPWRTIERAVCRIYKSDYDLDDSKAPDVRLRSARRIRNSCRVAMRHIERLSVQPERWVIDELLALEAFTDGLIRALSNIARRLVLH